MLPCENEMFVPTEMSYDINPHFNTLYLGPASDDTYISFIKYSPRLEVRVTSFRSGFGERRRKPLLGSWILSLCLRPCVQINSWLGARGVCQLCCSLSFPPGTKRLPWCSCQLSSATLINPLCNLIHFKAPCYQLQPLISHSINQSVRELGRIGNQLLLPTVLFI